MTQSSRLRRPRLNNAAKGEESLLREPLTPADRLLILLKIVMAVIILPMAFMGAAALLFYVLVGRA